MTKRYLAKITDGKYTEFPGITVISTIQEQDHAFWGEIYNAVNEHHLLKMFYAPLPLESYHMTTINICTEMDDCEDEWGDFIEERLDFYSNLFTFLNENQFNPSILRLKNIHVGGVIQLIVELDPAHIATIHQTANTYGLESKLPKEFHITLGYQSTLMPRNETEEIKEYLETKLEPFFRNFSTLSLNTPMLCYFHNMKKFEPWDARNNPFKSQANSSHSNFFSSLKHETKDKPRRPKKDKGSSGCSLL